MSLVFFPRAAACEALRLHDPTRLTQASVIGIDHARVTSTAIEVRTGASLSEAYLVFNVGDELDPGQHNLLELTMRTGPRIHRFKFLWKAVGASEFSYFVQQPIYRDGAFHTYLIPLSSRPSWRGSVSEIALAWGGMHGAVEVSEAVLRLTTPWDRFRVPWSNFWIPEVPNAATVNAIGGPTIWDRPLAWLLTLLAAALAFFIHRGSRWRGTGALLRVATWPHAGLLVLVVCWMLYDVRETYNHVQALRTAFRHALGNAPAPRHYFELDDFYDFMDAASGVVPKDGNVGFFSGRPLVDKARYFLFPRTVTNRQSDADFLLVFQDPQIAFSNGRLIERGRVISEPLTPFARFGEDAFIYKRSS